MSSKDTINFIKEYWIIFAFIAQIIFNYGGYIAFKKEVINDLDIVTKRIETIEQKSVTDALVISQINSRLASIETSLAFIRESLR